MFYKEEVQELMCELKNDGDLPPQLTGVRALDKVDYGQAFAGAFHQEGNQDITGVNGKLHKGLQDLQWGDGSDSSSLRKVLSDAKKLVRKTLESAEGGKTTENFDAKRNKLEGLIDKLIMWLDSSDAAVAEAEVQS